MKKVLQSLIEWLRYGFFYFRVLLLVPVPLICGLVRLFSQSLALKLEVGLLRMANHLFSQHVPIEPFLDREKFYHSLQVDDFRTLCRRLGKPDNWFVGCEMLDCGCGHGNLTRYLGERGAASVTGLDISPKSVEYASAKLKEEPVPNASFVEGSVYELPFSDNRFDAITSQVVFEHLFDVPQALSELYRVLKPGGLFYFTIDSFRCRYGAHLAHYVLVPWPMVFFSEAAVERVWRDGHEKTAAAHPDITIPDFFQFEWSLPSLNKITMAELDASIARSGFHVVSETEFADEKPLKKLFPWLKNFPRVYEYIRGSKAFLLTKPSDA